MICYDIDILDRITEFDILLWHFQNYVLQDMQFARSILLSIEKLGVKTFPNNSTAWHVDDKVAQMFLVKSGQCSNTKTLVFCGEKKSKKVA